MKLCYVFVLIFILIFQVLADSNLDFNSVMINTEKNPTLTRQAIKLAASQKLPTSILIDNETFMSPIIVDNGQVIYSVISNLTHPFQGGYLATFDQLETQFDLGSATIRYYGDMVDENHSKSTLAIGDSLYLIPESTGDHIMAFDANTGDLIDAAFILPQGAFSTPIEALYHNIRNSFVVSDQLEDLVQEFDTAGVFLGTFVPKGGQAEDTLNNVRGIGFHPNGNLLVTTASGANSDAIVEFDSDGNFVQNFITPNAALMDSPFDVLTRSGDILIPGLTNEVIARYDFSGTYLDYFTTGIDFPEQIVELTNGEIAAANFGVNFSGVQIFPSTGGSYTQLLNGVTGVRGVAELANGNILTTNGGGVHELDRSTGALVRTIQSGVSARFIGFYIVGQLPSLPSFSVNPQNIDFGTVVEDSSKTDTLFVLNSGNADLLISSITSDNPDFSVVPDTGVIAPGDSILFDITFTANGDSGLNTGNLVFTHNSPSSPDTVTMSANILTNVYSISHEIPGKFHLAQNYPNPFNPQTTIQFDLPQNSDVKLTVYNIQGEIISNLINKNLTAGQHNVVWDASDFGSGIYYLVLEANKQRRQTRKMILIK